MTPNARAIVPPNATPLERGMAALAQDRFDLSGSLLTDLWSADRCPPQLLGYLAWALSVDLWRDDWPVELKRTVVRNALTDQMRKGSLWLHKRYLSYAGAQLLRAIAPPEQLVLGRERTPAEYDALLARMPELRIYAQAVGRPVGSRAFWSRSFWSTRFWAPDDAALHHGTRVELRRNGLVIRCRIAEVPRNEVDAGLGSFSRIFIPHGIGAQFVFGASNGHLQRWWGQGRATDYVVAWRPASNLRATVTAGYDPAEATPRLVAEHHAAPRNAVWLGRRLAAKCYWRNTGAAAHYYQRLRLWDGKAVGNAVNGRSFWSHSWRNVPTHHATMAIDVSWPSPPRAQYRSHPRAGFLTPQDHTRLRDVLSAVTAAKLPHETLLIDFEPAFERRFYGAR